MPHIGYDVGKLADHAALAIVEANAEELQLRYLEQVPLGTPHSRTIARLRLITTMRTQDGWTIAADATGKGEPIVEALRAASITARIIGVTFTAATAPKQTSRHDWQVPKTHLIAKLRKAIEARRLKIADTLPAAAILLEELHNTRRTRRRSGTERIGANLHKQHDDLMIATALACWSALNNP